MRKELIQIGFSKALQIFFLKRCIIIPLNAIDYGIKLTLFPLSWDNFPIKKAVFLKGDQYFGCGGIKIVYYTKIKELSIE